MTNTLIARLEAATEPDRELDLEIHDALFGRWPPGLNPEYLTKLYTASIDAALTLVPEGWAWMVQKIDVGNILSSADLWIPGQRTQGLECERVCADAATPAIALIIACLMALQQEGQP